MGIHEAVHAYTAHWLGDDTAHDEGRITLNPLAHIDIFTTLLLPIGLIIVGLPPVFAAKPVPFNPDRVKYEEFGAALVGIAGPLSNLVMAVIAAGILRIFALPEVMFTFMLLFCAINVSFFVFNMIPFPPLDGSRLLYAFAPEPLQKVMYQIESLGFTAILIFIVLFVPVIGPLLTFLNTGMLQFLLGPLY